MTSPWLNGGIRVFLCWERWGLEDYTSDWNVKQLLQLPITSVRTLPETMQLVSKAERQTHPWEAWLDNKETSLKVKTGKLRFFFFKSHFTVIWLTENPSLPALPHPSQTALYNRLWVGSGSSFRWNVGLNKFCVCGIIYLCIKVRHGTRLVNKALDFDRHPSLNNKRIHRKV